VVLSRFRSNVSNFKLRSVEDVVSLSVTLMTRNRMKSTFFWVVCDAAQQPRRTDTATLLREPKILQEIIYRKLLVLRDSETLKEGVVIPVHACKGPEV
jgi:hypothetical protein